MEERVVWILPPEPPDRPAWIKTSADAPPTVTNWIPATLVHWRMTDPDAGRWTGLVRYSVAGLSYELWLPGEAIRAGDPQ